MVSRVIAAANCTAGNQSPRPGSAGSSGGLTHRGKGACDGMAGDVEELHLMLNRIAERTVGSEAGSMSASGYSQGSSPGPSATTV